MIDIHCPCGGHLQVMNEQVAKRARCPKCGRVAADILAAQAEAPALEGELLAGERPREPQTPSLDAEDAAREAARPPAETPDTGGEAVVACVHHPEAAATHNCMQCGNPLCMECVRTAGYYCSDECRAAVQAAEPDAAPATEQYAAVEAKVDRATAVAGDILHKLKWPVLIVLGLVVAWFAWTMFRGETRGTLVGSTSVSSEVATFAAFPLDAVTAIVQTGDDLHRVQIKNGTRDWTLNLQPLELPEAEAATDGETGHRWRDRLKLQTLHDGIAVVASSRQTLGIDADSGEVKWKLPPAATFRRHLEYQQGTELFFGTDGIEAVAIASGARRWGVAKIPFHTARITPAGDMVAVVLQPPPPARPAADDDAGADDTEEEVTAGGGQFNKEALLGMMGKRPARRGAPGKSYTVQFFDLATGAKRDESVVTMSDAPALGVAGHALYAMQGAELACFGSTTAPLWSTQFEAEISRVEGGGGLIVVALQEAVVALDAATGDRRWERRDLRPESLAVGPDGAVYLEELVDRNAAKQAPYSKYRYATVSTTGSEIPFMRVPVLLKLDAKSGATVWGVRNLGEQVESRGDKVFAIQNTEKIDLLAADGIMSGFWSAHCLSPRNGGNVWCYAAKGRLINHQFVDQYLFVVTATEAPSGRVNPSCSYQLSVIRGP